MQRQHWQPAFTGKVPNLSAWCYLHFILTDRQFSLANTSPTPLCESFRCSEGLNSFSFGSDAPKGNIRSKPAFAWMDKPEAWRGGVSDGVCSLITKQILHGKASIILSVQTTLLHISAWKTAHVTAKNLNSPSVCLLPLLYCCRYCLKSQRQSALWTEAWLNISPENNIPPASERVLTVSCLLMPIMPFRVTLSLSRMYSGSGSQSQ